jgi:hypothetical protein
LGSVRDLRAELSRIEYLSQRARSLLDDTAPVIQPELKT